MVDNSGSMGSKKTQTAEALVLAIETLRRGMLLLWRFGNKGASGHVALKTFEEPFNYATGQKILEGFTYSKGTHPGTNLQAIAHETWGSNMQPQTPFESCILSYSGASCNFFISPLSQITQLPQA